MKKLTLVFLCLFLFAALIGCTNSGGKDKIIEDGIVIQMKLTSLGGDNPDITRVTYSFEVWNRLGKSISVISVRPIISAEVFEKLVDPNLTLDVNIQLESNESRKISGTFQIDTKGMSKDEIAKLASLITQYKIVTEQIVGEK
ncbi:hypothetical protein [Paenibacillus paeoniae]|uniref:Uncharacterized protein n=1 Tax=Paenibacillus paeoniae TaxID=2292705 RepID=A0A371PJQ6_9BACL|nr:hypothetical protein [Paenibacillus paeoniae]REK76017.1 hypothetical protein DX130_02835 [Paenibacillus paeoniae]